VVDGEFLARYTVPGPFTGLGEFKHHFEGLEGDARTMARIVQGLLIHEGLAAAYQVTLPAERAVEKQLYSAVAMLSQSVRLDDRPPDQAREPRARVVGVCRHYATLFVALMRAKGVPARARCGFASYIALGKNVDHWIGEYWNVGESRWVLVDAQIDEFQRDLFRLTLDPLDVPRDRFLVSGDAWRACRDGADPMSFGVAGTQMWGLVEVYGDLFQDLAALQNLELLPWGWYGLATDKSGMEETDLIDRLATISSAADSKALSTLREMLACDERLRVPEATIAAIIAREEAAILQ
jgi:hypothetical protein